MRCFITGKELPSTQLVRVISDYPVKGTVHGKKVTTYKPYNIFIARYLYYNNSMELIDEVVKRMNSDGQKVHDSKPKGWCNKNKRNAAKHALFQ